MEHIGKKAGKTGMEQVIEPAELPFSGGAGRIRLDSISAPETCDK